MQVIVSNNNDLSVGKMKTVTVHAVKGCIENHGKECLKEKALRRPRKTDVEGADVTCVSRLFRVRAAAKGKA